MVERSIRGSGGAWRKSSRSDEAADCVEVAAQATFVLVRDSKNVSGGVLEVDPAHWRKLLGGIRERGCAVRAG